MPLKEAEAIAAKVARGMPRAEAHKPCVLQVVGFDTATVGTRGDRR